MISLKSAYSVVIVAILKRVKDLACRLLIVILLSEGPQWLPILEEEEVEWTQ